MVSWHEEIPKRCTETVFLIAPADCVH